MATSRSQRDNRWLRTPAVDHGGGPGSYNLAKPIVEDGNAGAAPFGSSGQRDVLRSLRKEWVTPGPDAYQEARGPLGPESPQKGVVIGGAGDRLHMDTVLKKNFTPGPGTYFDETTPPSNLPTYSPSDRSRRKVRWTKVGNPPSIPAMDTHGYDERNGQWVRVPRQHTTDGTPAHDTHSDAARRVRGVPFSSGGDQHTAFTVEKEAVLVPGPGMYEVSRDIRKVNKVFGVPYTLDSTVFKSGVQRDPFSIQSTVPGPGAYSIPSFADKFGDKALGAGAVVAGHGVRRADMKRETGTSPSQPQCLALTPSGTADAYGDGGAPGDYRASPPAAPADLLRDCDDGNTVAAITEEMTIAPDRKLIDSQQRTLRQVLGKDPASLAATSAAVETPNATSNVMTTPPRGTVTLVLAPEPPAGGTGPTLRPRARREWSDTLRDGDLPATMSAAGPPSPSCSPGASDPASPSASVRSKGVAPHFPPAPQSLIEKVPTRMAVAAKGAAHVPPSFARVAATVVPPGTVDCCAPLANMTSGFASTSARFPPLGLTPGPGHYIAPHAQGSLREPNSHMKHNDVSAFGTTTARFPPRRARLEIAAPHEQWDPALDQEHTSQRRVTFDRAAPQLDNRVKVHPDGAPLPAKPFKPIHQLPRPVILKKKSEKDIGKEFEKSVRNHQVLRKRQKAQAAALAAHDNAQGAGGTFPREARFTYAQQELKKVAHNPSPQEYVQQTPAPPGFAKTSGARFPKIPSTGPTATTYNTSQPFLRRTYNVTM